MCDQSEAWRGDCQPIRGEERLRSGGERIVTSHGSHGVSVVGLGSSSHGSGLGLNRIGTSGSSSHGITRRGNRSHGITRRGNRSHGITRHGSMGRRHGQKRIWLKGPKSDGPRMQGPCPILSCGKCVMACSFIPNDKINGFLIPVRRKSQMNKMTIAKGGGGG